MQRRFCGRTESTPEAVSADSVPEINAVEHPPEDGRSAETPTIMPPSVGTAVSSPPPNRRTGGYTEPLPLAEPIEEVQAEVQAEVQGAIQHEAQSSGDEPAVVDPPSALAAEVSSAATHHG